MKNKIGIIIGREFNERVRKKSFIITTLLTPLLMMALMFAPMLITLYSEGDEKVIMVVDDSNIVAPSLQSTPEVRFVKSPLPIELAMGEYDDCFALLHIGENVLENSSDVRFYTNGSTSIGLEQNITTQIEMVLQNEKLKQYDIENLQEILGSVKTRVDMQSYKNNAGSSEEVESSSSVVATVLAYILSFILYMFLLIYGAMVMQSVIEEKNNRVLEVLVSTVRPFDMMMGKILGIASVALVQVAIWIALIAGAIHLVLPHVLPEEILASMELVKQGAAPVTGADSGAGLLQAIIMMFENIGQIGGIVVWFIVFSKILNLLIPPLASSLTA